MRGDGPTDAAGAGSPQPRRRGLAGGPLLSLGFRPFFLAAGVAAVLGMAVSVALYLGWARLPSVLPPVTWHAHELLFGFAAAAVAGFVLTAAPNWTGRPPLAGGPLLLLLGLWAAGRLAVATSAAIGAGIAAVVDVAFLAVLALIVGREIIRGNNRRNRPVVAALALLAAANAGFHAEVLVWGDPTAPVSTRLAIAVLTGLVAFIGGRIVPAFTRNWLAKRQVAEAALPAPFAGPDRLALAALAIALAAWTVAPTGWPTALLLAGAAVSTFVRLARWRGLATLGEPLLWSLHLAYLWLPAGLALLALAAAGWLPALPAWHALTAGAMTAMILAVMTRASLGHTGRPLAAGNAETLIYGLALLAAVARIAAGLAPASLPLLLLSAGLWIACFVVFLARYGPILIAPRADRGS